jgi:hypothetical protein
VAALITATALAFTAISFGHDATFKVKGTIHIDSTSGQFTDLSGTLSSELKACIANRDGTLLFRPDSTGLVSNYGVLSTNRDGKWTRTRVGFRGGPGTIAATFRKATPTSNRHHQHTCKKSQVQIAFP